MSNFVDEAQVHVRGGDGGAGAVSFRREAHVARGGPDGGDGGSGGDVWLVAGGSHVTLLAFRDHPHRRAGDGAHGRGARRHGASGADVRVPVPVGTVVRDRSGAVVADLAAPGDSLLAARGGRGGRGNARFLSNARRAPSFAEQGERGEEHWYDLELKLVADAAIVGFPNAGKSTLLARVSAARPKIAPYPFTTLEPHLGVVRRPGGAGDLVLADVPGLIEGASQGRGLGHRFLRHVERARVLVLLCDLAEPEGRSVAEQQEVLLGELAGYRPELLARPRIVVGSRLDLAVRTPGAESAESAGCDLKISAVTGAGLDELLRRVAALVDRARAEPAVTRSPIVHRPTPVGVAVVRDPDGAFRVVGRAAERAVALADLTNPEAVAYVQARLHRLGVDRALARAGAEAGDVVRIAGHELTWELG